MVLFLSSSLSQTTLFVLFLKLSVISQVASHVVLTFPPARKYGLDFLDTYRTTTPCGMKKGGVRTSLETGKNVTITWHLAYPHQGGFKLELLDPSEKKLRDLTPNGQYVGLDNKEQQSYNLTISNDILCKDCTIRIVRQALEWGKKYKFQSCADVDIVARVGNTCSGHGTPYGSACICDAPFTGDRCQYKNDCSSDSDCNHQGKCLTISRSMLPGKQCYCHAGFFGQFCQRESFTAQKGFNESDYAKVQTRGLTFYWRILEDGKEMEGVAVANTMGYVAVGWRPKNSTKGCQTFPEDVPAPKGQDFHGMDCMDMVIGTVRDGLSRIGDYYSRDRSTPQSDGIFGGQDDLTGAVGWEDQESARTTIMFRKRLRVDHATDHAFSGKLQFIWAHGQNGRSFYQDDELKYHGSNRGSLVLDAPSLDKVVFPQHV